MSYTELTVWTRGIIMDKEGRDIVNSISASARAGNGMPQAMENYVDNPDRTNAPTRKYCRVSDGVIENELTYENEQPNIIVLVEGTMVKGWDYIRRMPRRRNPGDQHALHAEYMIRFVFGSSGWLNSSVWMPLNWPTTSGFTTGSANLASIAFRPKAPRRRNKAIAPDIAAPLIAAVVKTTGIVKMGTIEPMIANKHAFHLALEELHIMPLNPVAA